MSASRPLLFLRLLFESASLQALPRATSANVKASVGLSGRSFPHFFGPGKKWGRRRHPGFRARTTRYFFQGNPSATLRNRYPKCPGGHVSLITCTTKRFVFKDFRVLNSKRLLNSPALKTVLKLAQ